MVNLCEKSIDLNHTFRFTDEVDEFYFIAMSDELFSLSGDVEVVESRGRYDRSIVDEVWEQATQVNGNDSALWRQDEFGSMICRSEYGNRVSSFGWEIIETSSGSYQIGAQTGSLKALHNDNL